MKTILQIVSIGIGLIGLLALAFTFPISQAITIYAAVVCLIGSHAIFTVASK